MAFETLGLNVTASGIAGVARQMGHLANSFVKYINVVERTDRAALKAAASQNKLAETMLNKNTKALDMLMSKQDRLLIQYSRLDTAIQAARLTMRDPVEALNNYHNALQKVATAQKNLIISQRLMNAETPGSPTHTAFAAIVSQNRKELDKLNLELQKVTKQYASSLKEQTKYRNDMQQLNNVAGQLRKTSAEIPPAQQAVADSTIQAAQAAQTYQDALLQASGNTNILSGLLSDLTGGFGESTMATSGMAKALGLTVPQLTAAMVALDAVALAAKLAQAAIKVFTNVVRTIWNVVKRAAEIVWDLAKAIGTTLWNALKKITSFPFNIINSLFGGMGGSLKRIMEMAIGMNMSRVWWQLGMRIREMAKVAADAATEYQVTFMRLRGLILNELLGAQGVSPSDPEYIAKYNVALLEANKQTQELVTWTSKLAVATIFDAEAILDVYTLAMTYDFTAKSAKELTAAVLDFATGMGLGDTEMRRVIENFGQMRAQGKITGTELRDLARGAFVPVNEVLERMAKNAGVIGDYDVPNLQEITSVLTAMRESGELTESTFASISAHIEKLGADGKITRLEFETLATELKDPAVLQRFGLSAEQAGKALEGIKTGQLTQELNNLIATGKITIDEFFEAFIEMAEDRFPNAAMSMGLSMKALKSNLEDYIKTMFGWRLLAPVFEVVAKHVQNFVQNSLMSESQIRLFDRMGLAFKNITEFLLTYSDAVFKAGNLSKQFFGMGNISQIWRFANEFMSIIGSLGTEEFAEKFNIFEFALKQIPLAGEYRQLILSGIKDLNKIMADIMAGVEVDPDTLKKAMGNVFGTLWREYFKPELESLWDKNVVPAIKKKVGELWESIKTAFNTWKTDTLLPKLRTFLSETLPGWFNGITGWIEKNGGRLISNVLEFVQDIIDAFAVSSSNVFGEDHWLTRLLELLSSLAGYANVKIQNPAAEISASAMNAVADSFDRFTDSVGRALGSLGFVQKIYETISSPKFISGLGSYVAAWGAVYDMLYEFAELNIAPIDAVLDTAVSVINFIIAVFNIKKPSDDSIINMNIGKLSDFIVGLSGIAEILMGLGNLVLTGDWRKIEFAFKFLNAWARQDWKEIGKAFETALVDTGGIDSIVSGVEKLAGMDTKKATEKVEELTTSVGKWLDLEPGDREWDINTDINFNFNVNEIDPSDIPVGYAYNRKTGGLEYVGEGNVTLGSEYVIGIKVKNEVEVEDPTPSQIPAGFAWDPVTKELVFVGERRVSRERELIFSNNIYYTATETTGPPPRGTKWAAGPNGEKILVWIGEQQWVTENPGQELYIDFKVNLRGETTITDFNGNRVPFSGEGELWKYLGIPDWTSHGAPVVTLPSPTIQLSGLKAENFAAASGQLVQGFSDNITEQMALVDIPVPETPDTKEIGVNMGQGIIDGITSKTDDAVAAAKIFVNAVNAEFLKLWKIKSPSKVFFEFGENLIEGLILGIRQSTGDAVLQARDAAIDIKQGFGSSVNSNNNYSYTTNTNTNNWNVRMSTPIVASTPLQAYEVLRMRAR